MTEETRRQRSHVDPEGEDLFAPPEDGEREPGSAMVPVLTWMVCGLLIGVTLALTVQLTGGANSLATALGIAPIGFGAFGGWLAFRADRTLASARPALLDARGRRSRPVHALVFLVPMALCVPAFVWLVMVASVAMSSFVPGMMFAVGGFALGWAARRVVAQQAITQALQLLETGELEEAEALLENIAHGLWATQGSRRAAHLNLGLLALTSGDLDEAEKHYSAVRSGVGRTFAQAGLALVHALEDEISLAEDALHAALTGPGAQAVQVQTDTVRLLLTLRTEGAQKAREMGDRLLTLEAGDLFRGLLAFAHLQEGDEDGARGLLDSDTRQQLDMSWRAVVPEIAELGVALG